MLAFSFFLGGREEGARRDVEGEVKSCRPPLSISHVPLLTSKTDFSLAQSDSLTKKKFHIESSTQGPLSDESPVLPWLVEHAGCILTRCQKGRDGKTPFERLHGKKPTQEFVPFDEKVLAKQITADPPNRMNPRYKYENLLGMRNTSAECFIVKCRWCVQSL